MRHDKLAAGWGWAAMGLSATGLGAVGFGAAGFGMLGCERGDGASRADQVEASQLPPKTPSQPRPQQTVARTPATGGRTQHGLGAAEAEDPHDSEVAPTENQLMHDQRVPDVTFRMVSPGDDEVLPSGERVAVGFDLQGYRTSPELGQHVHVILDNEPYIAHYDASQSLTLENVSRGTHVLRAFPARHYHLALKEGDPFDVRTFHVGERSENPTFDRNKPFITYSRPKGDYSSEAAQALMLDFYVSNISLGEEAKVIYGVDGQRHELTEWKPVLLEPLSEGEHTITLQLVDGEGALIENGGFNDTTRTIMVRPSSD